jgi:hypothetical protein
MIPYLRSADGRVDDDVGHARHIQHDTAVVQRATGNVVTAAANRQLQIVAARESDDVRNVGGLGALNDERRFRSIIALQIWRAAWYSASCGVMIWPCSSRSKTSCSEAAFTVPPVVAGECSPDLLVA